MAYEELKNGQGIAFKNKKRIKDSHPDFTGNCKSIDGTECWVYMWSYNAKNGDKYFRFTMTEKDEKAKKSKETPF